jgi:hypothetical protein
MNTRLAALVLLPALTVAYAGSASFPEPRLIPVAVEAMQAHEAGPGTSGVAGIRTTVVAGEPSIPDPYTMRLTISPNTRIQAHTHRDNRSGGEGVQVKDETRGAELRGLLVKSIFIREAQHARVLLQHVSYQERDSATAAAGNQPVEQHRTDP